MGKYKIIIAMVILVCCGFYAIIKLGGQKVNDQADQVEIEESVDDIAKSDTSAPLESADSKPKPSEVVSAATQVSEQEQQAKYGSMSPRQAAQAFFQACTDRDWDELLKFWPFSGIEQRIKDYLGGLEVISLGEPVQSPNSDRWFVPYKIKLASGEIRERRLSILKNKNTGRFYYDGGI